MTDAENATVANMQTNIDASLNEKPRVDINSPGVAVQIAKRVKEDIDNYCIENYDDGFRWHLGASLIGQECLRAAWYGFHWAAKSRQAQDLTPEGRKQYARMQRLFNRGHREEFRFVEFLRGIGWEVYEYDMSKPMKEDGTYPQFRVSGYDGHFGGSLDGIGIPPESYGLGRTPFLLEFKTNGTGAGFKKLLEKGVILAKEQHFSQMSTYGSDENYKIEYALYQNICKNDDDLHVEVVKLDWKVGERMRRRAGDVISSRTPMPRLSDNPTFFTCKFCDYFKQCHENAPLEKNCRSCKHSKPVDGGEWLCELANSIIPREFVPNGCNSWQSVNVVSG